MLKILRASIRYRTPSRERCTAVVVTLCLGACFVEPATTTPSTDATTGGSTATDDDSGSSTATSTGVQDNSSGGSTPATLEISLEPFGDVDLGGQQTRLARIFNRGSLDATELEFSSEPPFSLIETGCGTTLVAGSQCPITLEFDGRTLGPAQGIFSATYDNGFDAATESVSLAGDVRGSTGELIANGGFELCDDGPDQPPFPAEWENVGPTDSQWACQFADVAGNIDPQQGERMVGAFAGPNDVPFELRQVIDLVDYAALIDTGALQALFEANATTLAPDNDQYRVVLEYLDAAARPLETFDTGWQSAADDQGAWAQHSEASSLDPAVEQVSISLLCIKNASNNCDAFFDSVTLTLVY